MNFGLSLEVSAPLEDKADFIFSYSKLLEDFFRNKNYGMGIESLVIGVILVHPKFDSFFLRRNKYTKSQRLFEYDIKLDFAESDNSDRKKIYEILSSELLKSIHIIDEEQIEEFDTNRFKNDLEEAICRITATNQ
jgi:hypothetical protein